MQSKSNKLLKHYHRDVFRGEYDKINPSDWIKVWFFFLSDIGEVDLEHYMWAKVEGIKKDWIREKNVLANLYCPL